MAASQAYTVRRVEVIGTKRIPIRRRDIRRRIQNDQTAFNVPEAKHVAT